MEKRLDKIDCTNFDNKGVYNETMHSLLLLSNFNISTAMSTNGGFFFINSTIAINFKRKITTFQIAFFLHLYIYIIKRSDLSGL